jgi:hypothetical protein
MFDVLLLRTDDSGFSIAYIIYLFVSAKASIRNPTPMRVMTINFQPSQSDIRFALHVFPATVTPHWRVE